MDLPQEWKETSHDQSRGDSKKKKRRRGLNFAKKKRKKSFVMIEKSAQILLFYGSYNNFIKC